MKQTYTWAKHTECSPSGELETPMQAVHRRQWRGLLMFSLLLLAVGCTTLLPQGETVRLFILTPYGGDMQSEPRWSAMSLNTLSASRFDTNRLLLVENQQELLPYRGARWAEPLPELVLGTWGRSLEQAGISVISHDAADKRGVRPALIIHIREFQAQLTTPGQATCRVAIVMELITAEKSQPLLRHFSAEAQVATDDAAGVAAGFDRAHAEVLDQGLRWLSQIANG